MNINSKTILLIAFEFHPCRSSGVQRPSSFAKELQKKGWNVILLTARSDAYTATDDSPNPIPEANIFRIKAENAAKKYSINGKYLQIIEVPDRYWPWVFTSTPVGKKIIRKFNPDIIFSTYPFIGAHIIAYRLAKWSGLPWVADYRDPVKCHYENVPYPSVSRWLDKKFVNKSTKSIFTTQRAKDLYISNFPEIDVNKFHVIENGFDENNFANVTSSNKTQTDKYQLLHSGSVFPPNGRNPIPLFRALSKLKLQGALNSNNFVLRFRGGPIETEFAEVVQELDIQDIVEFLPGVPYVESLQEMIDSDGLLIIQGMLFDNQVPGKLYEYIRTRKPILGAVTNTGATADLLKTIPMSYIGDSIDDLCENLIRMLETKGKITAVDTYKYSRQERAERLHLLLESCLKVN